MQGNLQFVALALTPEALDCWHITFSNTAAVGLTCLWSLNVSRALSHTVPHFDQYALAFSVRGAQLCVLQAVQLGSEAQADWQLCLSFHLLSTLDATGLWGTRSPELVNNAA